MSLTCEAFVQWLHEELNNPHREPLSKLEVVKKLEEVEIGDSQFVLALAEHEKLSALMRAGFTRQEAFFLVAQDRKIVITMAVHHGYHQGDQNGD